MPAKNTYIIQNIVGDNNNVTGENLSGNGCMEKEQPSNMNTYSQIKILNQKIKKLEKDLEWAKQQLAVQSLIIKYTIND